MQIEPICHLCPKHFSNLCSSPPYCIQVANARLTCITVVSNLPSLPSRLSFKFTSHLAGCHQEGTHARGGPDRMCLSSAWEFPVGPCHRHPLLKRGNTRTGRPCPQSEKHCVRSHTLTVPEILNNRKYERGPWHHMATLAYQGPDDPDGLQWTSKRTPLKQNTELNFLTGFRMKATDSTCIQFSSLLKPRSDATEGIFKSINLQSRGG